MYRGEPPPEYFSSNWNPNVYSYVDDDISSDDINIFRQLIGIVGASSTTSTTRNQPTRWAPLNGYTSDGRVAMIRTSEQTRQKIGSLPYKEDYVFGRYNSTTGYYHIETRAAHTILLVRVNKRIHSLESELFWANCGCGGSSHQFEIQKIKKDLDRLTNFLENQQPNP